MMLTLVIRIRSNKCGDLGARGLDKKSGILVNISFDI